MEQKTCKGFVKCHHTTEDVKPRVVVRHLFDKWNEPDVHQYTIIEENSGMPIVNDDGKFTLHWNDSAPTFEHVAFWEVDEKRGVFVPGRSRNTNVTTFNKYVVTSMYSGMRWCLLYAPEANMVEWRPCENLNGEPYNPLIVWHIAAPRVRNIKEGTMVALYPEAEPDKFVSKQSTGCDFFNNPVFGVEAPATVSVLDNKKHGKGVHEESTPLCRFTDCNSPCTLMHFQIMGRDAQYTKIVPQKSNEAFRNAVTTSEGLFSWVVIFLVAIFVPLLLLHLYYSIVPAKYDYTATRLSDIRKDISDFLH